MFFDSLQYAYALRFSICCMFMNLIRSSIHLFLFSSRLLGQSWIISGYVYSFEICRSRILVFIVSMYSSLEMVFFSSSTVD